MLKVLSNILCDLDPKVKVIGQKVAKSMPADLDLYCHNVFKSLYTWFQHSKDQKFLLHYCIICSLGHLSTLSFEQVDCLSLGNWFRYVKFFSVKL